jgi:hypothetical protein
VWLASVSLRDSRDNIIGTSKWTPRHWQHARKLLSDVVLNGCGDLERERMFRMCITLCLHRGLRPDELASIPDWWHQARATDLAGGPLEIIYSKGISDIESAKPCHNPRQQLIDMRRLDLWLPLDCGQCPPCVARQNVRCPVRA